MKEVAYYSVVTYYQVRMWSIADTPGIANYFLAYTPGYC